MASIKKNFGDRKDACRVKNITGMSQIMIDLKPRRCDSDVYINQKMDVTKLVNYIQKKKSEGEEITYFHAFVTAIGKVLYNRPRLNYFVANRHIYEHNNISIAFVAKITFDDKSEELMSIINIDPKDNIYSISKKIKDNVDAIRSKEDKVEKRGANSAIDVLGKLPNIVRVPILGLFKWCDKKGILPSSLIEDNLYYSSIIVSNLGAIKCGAIYHNLTDFGTASSLATMGEIRKEQVIDVDGKKHIKSICEFGVNLDERIADGYYFVKCLQLLQYIFDNPELMEVRADEKIKTNEIR